VVIARQKLSEGDRRVRGMERMGWMCRRSLKLEISVRFDANGFLVNEEEGKRGSAHLSLMGMARNG